MFFSSRARAKSRYSVFGALLGAFALSALLIVSNSKVALAEEGVTKVHVLALSSTDAIIIESNGRFGMVDSGESSDYPDGSDPRYPYRSGTTIGDGVEEELFSYLDSLGVTEDNFDFYIGTHPHSDHIGTAGLIIRTYKPSKVYTPRYDDSYITSAWGLWDNQYVYDRLVSATNEVGAELYLEFEESAPEVPEAGSHVCKPEFDFGSAHIELVNTDPSYEAEGAADANYFSLGVVVKANGKVAYLAGDICNSDGDEDNLAQTLGHVDFMKLGHHGAIGSNTYSYMQALSPEVVFQTNSFEWLWDQPLKAIRDLGCQFYNSERLSDVGIPAFVVELSSGGIKTNMEALVPWISHNYYTGCYEAFDESGITCKLDGWHEVLGGYAFFDGSSQSLRNAWVFSGGVYSYLDENALRIEGWKQIDGTWYYFDANGAMQTGWVLIGGSWYWFYDSGAMATGLAYIDGTYSSFSSSGEWLGSTTLRSGWNLIGGDWYYVTSDGQISTGWLETGGTWYWLDSFGKMTTSWQLVDGTWFYFDGSGAMVRGWHNVSGLWYWFDASGAMATGWKHIGSAWYLLSDAGSMRTGWAEEGGSWYWLSNSGAMKTSWLYLGGTWYWLSPSSGSMETGWQYIDGDWYYMEAESGAMRTGWLHDGSSWYYLSDAGKMQCSRWIGNYYVLANGEMARNQWIGPYYVGDDGAWVA